jgi:Ala-tRNA(Pro) deacylase
MNVTQFLQQQQIPFEFMSHPDTFDAQHLAAMVHVSGRQVAKTVLVRTGNEECYAVVVLPANRKIQFEPLRMLLQTPTIGMATEVEMAALCADCEVGALLPFGSHYGLPTVIDESLYEFEEMVFEGNTHHESIRMKMDDFRRLEQPLVGAFT